MSLKHVSIWKESIGWIRISPKKANELFSHSISAKKKIFICDLCHEYVTFIKSNSKVSHFKHSKNNYNKNCSERTQFIHNKEKILYKTITNPIKLRYDNYHIVLEIGFLPMPVKEIDNAIKLNLQICIFDKKQCLITKNIDYSNFSSESVCYYSIGENFAEEYEFKVLPEIKSNFFLYNRKFPGLNVDGTIFDYNSKKNYQLMQM